MGKTSGKIASLRYLIIAGICSGLFLALLSIVAYLILHADAKTYLTSASLINMSGRQRMLSQRITHFALLFARNKDQVERELWRKQLLETVDLMEISHIELIKDVPSANLPGNLSPEVRTIYFDPPVSLDAQVRSFVSKVKAFANVPVDELTQDNPHLRYILTSASGELLNSLDMVVKKYQEESERNLIRLQRLESLVLGVTLSTILMMALFIFRPMVRRIQKETNLLEDAKKTLALRVRERTQELSMTNKELLNEINERKKVEEVLLKKAEELDIMNKDLNNLSMEMTRVEERERKRFAEVLHEGIGQILVAIKLTCSSCVKAPQSKKNEKVSQIVSLIDRAIQSTRSMTAELYPPMLDDLGLDKTVEWYLESTIGFSGIKVSLNIDKSVEDSDDVSKRFIFRIIKECFHNILKHSGASSVELVCKKENDCLKLSVRDNGVGFLYEKAMLKKGSGIGLMFIRDKVKALKGQFNLRSAPGKGTEVLVELPAEISRSQEKRDEGRG